MNDREERIYVGSGRIVTAWKRGISVCVDDLEDYAVMNRNGKRYVSLNIVDRNEPNRYGKDVDVLIDTWKPGDEKPSSSYRPRTERHRAPQQASRPQTRNYTSVPANAPTGPESFADDVMPF